MLQAVSLVRPRHWLHPLHLFNREPQCFTLEEHVKVPIRIRLQRSSCEPRLVRSRLVVNKPLCKHKGYLTYGGIGEWCQPLPKSEDRDGQKLFLPLSNRPARLRSCRIPVCYSLRSCPREHAGWNVPPLDQQ